VVCASVNEAGVPDTRCPTPGSKTIEVCNASNSGWTLQQTCPGSSTCHNEEDPRNANPESCSLTQSDLQLVNPTDTCNMEFGDGPPISCGGKSDCCLTFCQRASNAAPAVCL
jgi:hypothetical protein